MATTDKIILSELSCLDAARVFEFVLQICYLLEYCSPSMAIT